MQFHFDIYHPVPFYRKSQLVHFSILRHPLLPYFHIWPGFVAPNLENAPAGIIFVKQWRIYPKGWRLMLPG